MSTELLCQYLGDEQVEIIHGPTGNKLLTDLPPDNGGRGRTFSPTDLTAGSLASCILTIMAKAAEKNHLDIKGTSLKITKDMQDNPRRIGKFILQFSFPPHISSEQKEKLMVVIKACPVHRSLHPDVHLEVHS
ncbi:MAG: OsmC family protein [Pseudomonadota bacterium]